MTPLMYDSFREFGGGTHFRYCGERKCWWRIMNPFMMSIGCCDEEQAWVSLFQTRNPLRW